MRPKGGLRSLFGDRGRKLSSKTLLSWIFSYLKPYKKTLIRVNIFLVFLMLIQSSLPLIIQIIIDNGVFFAGNSQFILNWTIIYIISLIGTFTFEYLVQLKFGTLGQKVMYKVRTDLFNHLQDMSMSYFDQHLSGDIISICTNDVDLLNEFVGHYLLIIISQLLSLGLIIGFMFVLSPALALVSLLIIPIYLITAWVFQKSLKASFMISRKKISKVTSALQENIAGAKIIKAFGREEAALAEFDKVNLENYLINLKIHKMVSVFFPFVELISTFFTILIVFIYGGFTFGQISFFGLVITTGVFVAFLNYLTKFFRPIMAITLATNIIESSLAASERIYLLLNEDVSLPDPEHPIELKNINWQVDFKNVTFIYPTTDSKSLKNPQFKLLMSSKKSQMVELDEETLIQIAQKLGKMLNIQKSMDLSTGEMGSGGRRGPPAKAWKGLLMRLCIAKIGQNVFNQFPKNVQELINEQRRLIEHKKSRGPIFKNFDLNVPEGQTLAIAGETGVGKTTLIKLLCRFYDIQEGEILIDGINIKNVTKKDLRDNIGLVPQDNFLFEGSIKENLLYGFKDNDINAESKMLEISKLLKLHDFIELMPEKYETQLIENGTNISIGQRQLIAFARALINDPKILILDEATSSVDPYSELLIQEALDKIRKNRTTIIIAHRLSTIKNADQIIVLDQGKIIEKGTHEQLLELNGKYKKLVEKTLIEIQS